MNKLMTLAITTVCILSACAEAQTPASKTTESVNAPEQLAAKTDTAIFAGGCFWCIEADFEKLPGVIEAVSGYTGGHTKSPTYKDVTYTDTGHYEAVKVIFNPAQVSYSELVEYFWVHVDPTDPFGQFCDKGDSYRTAIFARPDQIDIADSSKANVIANKPFRAEIVTPVLPTGEFFDAEDYHQDYYKKNKIRYKYYRNGCGRDNRVEQLWGVKN